MLRIAARNARAKKSSCFTEPIGVVNIDWDESVHIKSTYTAGVLVGGILPSSPVQPSPWWMWVLLGIFLLVAFLVSRARRRR